MIDEIANIMEARYENENLSIEIPAVFDHLKGEDANFELVTSNDSKPLRLFLNDNIVT